MNLSHVFQSAFRALSAAFGAVEKTALAADKLASAGVNIATVAEETSGTYLDQTRADRAKKMIEIKADIKALEAAKKAT